MTPHFIEKSVVGRYPLELTQFKTPHYRPGDHFRCPKKWDNFTMHVPTWEKVLNHFFSNREHFKVLELGSGNGLCANYLLDSYKCSVVTVDIEDLREVEEDGVLYEVKTSENLKPFLNEDRCFFYQDSTKIFLNSRYRMGLSTFDFIYVDASHDKDWVLHDAVKSFDFLKVDGLMIFDDYGWGECSKGIDAFLENYSSRIEVFHKDWQVMLRKTKELV